MPIPDDAPEWTPPNVREELRNELARLIRAYEMQYHCQLRGLTLYRETNGAPNVRFIVIENV